jgi:exodeoxyribonuclease-3
MKIISWNVNGLQSILNKDLIRFAEEKNTILCLQETKMQENLFANSIFPSKNTYWNYAKKAGYSGVATAIDMNMNPISIIKGIGDTELDKEGRVLTLEFESFILINTYAPHSHRKLLRLEAKELFMKKFLVFIANIRKLNKPIIIVGDLNVAHQEIDLYHYKNNKNNAGFLPQERQWFDDILSLGFIDIFRYLYPNKKSYSWWGLVHGLRERDIGWRLDYILVDESIKNKVEDCYYQKNQLGSDHCPVVLEIDV